MTCETDGDTCSLKVSNSLEEAEIVAWSVAREPRGMRLDIPVHQNTIKLIFETEVVLKGSWQIVATKLFITRLFKFIESLIFGLLLLQISPKQLRYEQVMTAVSKSMDSGMANTPVLWRSLGTCYMNSS